MKYPILAIETTGAFASVALKNDDGRLFTENLTEKLNHLKGLLPLIDRVLDSSGLGIGDVQNIAVSVGPGSFTGIRIGISTVRALAQVTGAKIIGVPTLEAFVYNNPKNKSVACPVFDARMNQMYAGAFKLTDAGIDKLIGTDAYNPSEYLNLLTKLIVRYKEEYKTSPSLIFYGDGIEVFKPDINQWGKIMKKEYFTGFTYKFEKYGKLQFATSVLKWAENFGVEKEYSDIHPEYVRKAEAQRRLDEKNACRV